jgi:hypothetical protein
MADFEATDTRGRIYRRASNNLTYTHCVVIHIRGHSSREAYSRAEWAGSLARAKKNAMGWSNKSYVESVDLLEARVISNQ